MRRTDLVSAFVLALTALFCLAWLIPAHTAAAQSPLDLPPSLMANIAMSTIGALALLLGLVTYLDGRKSRSGAGDLPADDEEFGREATGIGGAELINLTLWAGASIVVVLLMQVAGYVISAVLLLIAMMIFAGQRNYKIIAIIGIGAPVLIAQLSWHLFSIELPPMPFLDGFPG